MNFETIWSLQNIPTAKRFRLTADWAARNLAKKLPGNIRYWAAMSEISKVSRNNPDALTTPLEEVIKNIQSNTNRMIP